jgi:hypothetical protein
MRPQDLPELVAANFAFFVMTGLAGEMPRLVGVPILLSGI